MTDTTAQCGTKKITCSDVQSFLHDPCNCGNYLQCVNRVLHTRSCPPGTYFQISSGRCNTNIGTVDAKTTELCHLKKCVCDVSKDDSVIAKLCGLSNGNLTNGNTKNELQSICAAGQEPSSITHIGLYAGIIFSFVFVLAFVIIAYVAYKCKDKVSQPNQMAAPHTNYIAGTQVQEENLYSTIEDSHITQPFSSVRLEVPDNINNNEGFSDPTAFYTNLYDDHLETTQDPASPYRNSNNVGFSITTDDYTAISDEQSEATQVHEATNGYSLGGQTVPDTYTHLNEDYQNTRGIPDGYNTVTRSGSGQIQPTIDKSAAATGRVTSEDEEYYNTSLRDVAENGTKQNPNYQIHVEVNAEKTTTEDYFVLEKAPDEQTLSSE